MENPTIVQNWKALIKPSKLNIKSNEDKTITTVIAEPVNILLMSSSRTDIYHIYNKLEFEETSLTVHDYV